VTSQREEQVELQTVAGKYLFCSNMFFPCKQISHADRHGLRFMDEISTLNDKDGDMIRKWCTSRRIEFLHQPHVNSNPCETEEYKRTSGYRKLEVWVLRPSPIQNYEFSN
jgi:hypothetical protein